jgi:glycosyltransferase involved in cell wall biosynthesis
MWTHLLAPEPRHGQELSAITIITSTLNSRQFLKHSADSVFRQTSKNWQWIMVDGASSDGMSDWLDGIAGLRSNVAVISESDRGIYDAWNKALPLVPGTWVLFMGAVDKLKSPDVLQDCAQLLAEVSPDMNQDYGLFGYINKN